MENVENPTTEAKPTAASTPAEGGAEAASQPAESLTLAEINEITGKNYKSKDSALKSLRDMTKQAGKVADLEGKLERSAEESTTAQRLAELETDNFFARNPQHEANRELLEALAKANGVSVKEASELGTYKSTVERMQAAQPAQRTVMESSQRQNAGGEGSFDPKGKSADELAAHVTETYFKQ